MTTTPKLADTRSCSSQDLIGASPVEKTKQTSASPPADRGHRTRLTTTPLS